MGQSGEQEGYGGSDGKVSAYNVGDPGSILGLGRFPWRRKWQPTPVFLPGKSHGRKSMAGYSPWGCKESDTTERLHFTSFVIHTVFSQMFDFRILLSGRALFFR